MGLSSPAVLAPSGRGYGPLSMRIQQPAADMFSLSLQVVGKNVSSSSSERASEKRGDSRRYERRYSDRDQRDLGARLRGRHPAGHSSGHQDPEERRGCLGQGSERHDRRRQHKGLQGQPGDHLRAGRVASHYPGRAGTTPWLLLAVSLRACPTGFYHRVGSPTLLGSDPSLCPSQNGGAPTLHSPFPLLGGIKAQTLREEIVHSG